MIGRRGKIRLGARVAALLVLVAFAALSPEARAEWRQVAQDSSEFDELEALKRLTQEPEEQSPQPAETVAPAWVDPDAPKSQPQPAVEAEPAVPAQVQPDEAADSPQTVTPESDNVVQPLADPASEPSVEPIAPEAAPEETERAARPPSTLFEKEIEQLFDPQPLGEGEGVLGDLPTLPPDPPAPQESVTPLDETEQAEVIEQLDELNPVMARVGGTPIYWSEVTKLAERLPDSMQGRLEVVYPLLLQRLVDFKLLVMAGRNLGLEEQPELRARVAAFEEHLIGRSYLDRFLRDRVTPDALRRRYDEVVQDRAGNQQMQVRHILLASKEDALAVIEELEQGADFVALAQERSIGGTAARGGSLGRVPVNRMVPAFSAAALALSPGDYTREPVRTQFGWHVILLEEGPDTAVPDFAGMEEELRQEVSQQQIDRLLGDLRSTTEIELLPGLTEGEANAAAAPQPEAQAGSKSD